MKSTLITIAIFIGMLASSDGFTQEWGVLRCSSRLLHREEIRWFNSNGPNNPIKLIRTFNYPATVMDERHAYPIGFITVKHTGCGINAETKLRWGGPRSRYVGLKFVSAPGECINSVVEIYSKWGCSYHIENSYEPTRQYIYALRIFNKFKFYPQNSKIKRTWCLSYSSKQSTVNLLSFTLFSHRWHSVCGASPKFGDSVRHKQKSNKQ